MVNEYQLKVPVQAMRVIIGALQELPYKVSAAVLQDIFRQTDEQEQAALKPADSEQEEK